MPVAEAGDLPLRARSLAVSFPMPVLAPVIITTFPSSLAVDLHWPPATYLLRERPAALRDEVRGHRPSSGASGQGSAPGDPGFYPEGRADRCAQGPGESRASLPAAADRDRVVTEPPGTRPPDPAPTALQTPAGPGPSPDPPARHGEAPPRLRRTPPRPAAPPLRQVGPRLRLAAAASSGDSANGRRRGAVRRTRAPPPEHPVTAAASLRAPPAPAPGTDPAVSSGRPEAAGGGGGGHWATRRRRRRQGWAEPQERPSPGRASVTQALEPGERE